MITLNKPVAGKSWFFVENVSRPTMTVYSPNGKNTGVAVVVLPGGGFQGLAIDLEGEEACDWLTSRGITCVLLKYRVPSLPYDSKCKCLPKPIARSTAALEDAQRTMGLVRRHASEWKIDSHKIGVLGFSAGGYIAAELSTNFERRIYSPVDAADQESCRPDFAALIYPALLSASSDTVELNTTVPVSGQTPPTFLLQAEDDHMANISDSLAYYIALKNHSVPAEMHLYADGGHAFGLRRTESPITGWPQLMKLWLRTIHVETE